jgi:hypothetical protein
VLKHWFFCAENGIDGGWQRLRRSRQSARALIKRGYTPKIAVDLVLHELESEYGSHSRKMDQARTDAEDFLRRLSQGLL